MPTPREVGNPNAYLTNVALAWATQNADAYIMRKVFPVVPVGLKTSKYRTFPKSYWYRDEVGPRPLNGYPRQIDYKTSEDSYNCEVESLEFVLPDQVRANYVGPPSMSPEAAGVRLLQTQHLTHGDIRWASGYFKAGVWGIDLTGVASAPSTGQFLQWNNANSDPIDILSEQIDAVGDKVGGVYRPNKLVLGVKSYRKLRNHPSLLGRLGVNDTRQINKAMLARLLEVDEVLVPQATKNTGPEKGGATMAAGVTATEAAASYSRIIDPEDALLVYAASTPSQDEPSGGYTFAWSGLLGAQAADPTAAVTQGRDDRGKFDWFQLDTAYDLKVVAPELGVFMKDAVA